ncbi:uncharacterized protein METZ01_LOCUS344436, partial [marine metagenome]
MSSAVFSSRFTVIKLIPKNLDGLNSVTSSTYWLMIFS